MFNRKLKQQINDLQEYAFCVEADYHESEDEAYAIREDFNTLLKHLLLIEHTDEKTGEIGYKKVTKKAWEKDQELTASEVWGYDYF